MDLQTGGVVHYDDVLAAMKDNDADADDLIFAQDTFFQNNIVSQIKAK